MKRETYEEIRRILLSKDEKYPLQLAQKRHPEVTVDTLLSIYSQECSRHLRLNHHQYRNPRRIGQYIRRYASGKSMLQISEEFDMPACLLARILLEHVVKSRKSEITPILRDPASLPAGSIPLDVPSSKATGSVVKISVPSERLKKDIRRCVENDPVSSPHAEHLRHLAGLEYEELLRRELESLGVAYESEEALRAAGFSKTPDVRLLVPIAVRGHVVHWIDSKASFGDEFMYRTQASEQFQRYVNRFGPGLVIYWFDFIEGLEDNPDVLLMKEFPKVNEIHRLQEIAIEPPT